MVGFTQLLENIFNVFINKKFIPLLFRVIKLDFKKMLIQFSFNMLIFFPKEKFSRLSKIRSEVKSK